MVCAYKLLTVRKKKLKKKIFELFLHFGLKVRFRTCALFQDQRNRVASNKPKNKK